MKTVFFGYNRKLSDQYLEEKNKNNEEKLITIKVRNDSAAFALKTLMSELEEILIEKKRIDKEKELIDLANSRIKKTVSLINIEAKKESEEIITRARKKLVTGDGMPANKKQDIFQAKEKVEALLSEVQEIIDNTGKRGGLKGKEKSEKSNDNSEKVEETTEEVDEGSVIPEKTNAFSKPNLKLVNFFEKQATKKEEIEEKELQKPEEYNQDVAEEKPEEKIEKKHTEVEIKRTEGNSSAPEAFWKSEVQQKMTADGLILNTSVVSSVQNQETQYKKTRDVMPRAKHQVLNNNVKSEPTFNNVYSDFWDDYLVDTASFSTADAGTVEKKQRFIPAREEIAVSAQTIVKNENSKDVFVPSVKKEENIKKSSDNAGVKSDTLNTIKPTKSNVVAEEINNIRVRYIVGKLAGETLLDSEGRTIISKNNEITQDIILRAEREGKLSELIINMVLPGMES